MGRRKFLFFSFIILILIVGCGRGNISQGVNEGTTSAPDESFAETMNEEPSLIGPMELSYATEYSVDLYEHGYAHIHVADGNSYVLIPEGKPVVSLGDEDATIIQMPCDSIYLAASSVMDLFHELEALENIRSCSTKAEDYGNQEVQTAIESGNIQYVGKYSAPDYEQLITNQTCLAIESTMIYHSPKIKEELEGLGIPVLVERSSYEGNPLGRLEWIKLYGLLLGKRELAEELFEKQMENVNSVLASLDESEKEKPKVLFFYLSSNGYVNVRKPGDYVSKMIAMAGGEYAMDSLQIDEENALSTVNISWEDFYYYGKDADIIIYNGTIDGGITSKEDLLQQNALFQEFKAVQENRVYCSTGNMYQESSKIGEIIENLYAVIHQKETTLDYINYVD